MRVILSIQGQIYEDEWTGQPIEIDNFKQIQIIALNLFQSLYEYQSKDNTIFFTYEDDNKESYNIECDEDFELYKHIREWSQDPILICQLHSIVGSNLQQKAHSKVKKLKTPRQCPLPIKQAKEQFEAISPKQIQEFPTFSDIIKPLIDKIQAQETSILNYDCSKRNCSQLSQIRRTYKLFETAVGKLLRERNRAFEKEIKRQNENFNKEKLNLANGEPILNIEAIEQTLDLKFQMEMKEKKRILQQNKNRNVLPQTQNPFLILNDLQNEDNQQENKSEDINISFSDNSEDDDNNYDEQINNSINESQVKPPIKIITIRKESIEFINQQI